MEKVKNIAIEEGRLLLYNTGKIFFVILEEIMSFFSRMPKILGFSVGLFGIYNALMCFTRNYFVNGIKVLLLFGIFAIATYFVSILLMKPFNKHIFNGLESIRAKHHDLNCGIYMGVYKNKLQKEDSIENMLCLKELLETNILLSSLKLKIKLIFDENNNVDYKKILSNGLSMGTALCFSANSNIENDEFIDTNKEFVIENDAFIKEFKEFCKENPDDIEEQISFLKNNIRRINSKL